MYYSKISKCTVSEEEAHTQIIRLCEKWFRLTHPEGNFEKYFIKHPEIFLIERWPDFKKLEV